MKISKEKVIEVCIAHVEDKLVALSGELAKIKEGIATETKSSMGDKYETSREMMSQERNKLDAQVSIQKRYLHELLAIDVTKSSDYVQHGSLVATSNLNYFIGAALGKVLVADTVVYVISQNAPICKELMGKGMGEEIRFNNQKFTISYVG